MEDLGKEIASSTCKNCGEAIRLVRWEWAGDVWQHSDFPSGLPVGSYTYCAGSPVAEPLEEN